MRVFVAGATGAIGRQLVPRLVEAGHEVHGMTRSESKRAMLHELGAVPVVADALDPDQVAEAVGKAKPDVLVHQLTALAGRGMRGLKRRIAMTNRLRSAGTDHLLSAGQAVGVRRFVAQSNYALYARTGGPVKSEGAPLDLTPPRKQREAAAAIFHLEEAVLDAGWTEGIVLRYGGFYGPGTNMAPGEFGVLMMTEARGASNAKAKRELGWSPAHPSWREGFAPARPSWRRGVTAA